MSETTKKLEKEQYKGHIIRIRKTEVTLEGKKRIIVMIRDLTDTIEVDKIQIKLKEDNTR